MPERDVFYSLSGEGCGCAGMLARKMVANLGLNSGHHTDSYTNHKPTGFGCVSVQEIL